VLPFVATVPEVLDDTAVVPPQDANRQEATNPEMAPTVIRRRRKIFPLKA
jgi:hypothetical protein